MILILIMWGIRVYKLNTYYWHKDSVEELYYSMDEYVEFGNNYFMGNYVDGYSVKADTYQIMDTVDFLNACGVDADAYRESVYVMPERVCVVSITVRNEESTAEGIVLSDIRLCGIDYYVFNDIDFFAMANPELGYNAAVTMKSHSEHSVNLVYGLFEQDFTKWNWNHMNRMRMMLLTTGAPQMQYIVLQN
jgi:hypothetical protein